MPRSAAESPAWSRYLGPLPLLGAAAIPLLQHEDRPLEIPALGLAMPRPADRAARPGGPMPPEPAPRPHRRSQTGTLRPPIPAQPLPAPPGTDYLPEDPDDARGSTGQVRQMCPPARASVA